MRICVYGAASEAIDRKFMKATEEFGQLIAMRGHSLVFGGGGHGLMGAVARGVRSCDAHILGVIPKFFETDSVELIYNQCNELIMPDTMRQRKEIMEENADAFVMVPGGIGTFEEFFEILTLKQLCRHNKPIAVYNLYSYFDSLESLMNAAIQDKFVRDSVKELYFISDDPNQILEYVEAPIHFSRSIKELKDG